MKKEPELLAKKGFGFSYTDATAVLTRGHSLPWEERKQAVEEELS
ncbi:UNVERIFIED_CONTAM: hypothetical protein ABID98_004854 [Brevibacillus sp. OAP136]